MLLLRSLRQDRPRRFLQMSKSTLTKLAAPLLLTAAALALAGCSPIALPSGGSDHGDSGSGSKGSVGQSTAVTCDGGTAQLAGTNEKATLSADCDTVQISGTGDVVIAKGITTLVISGSNAKVTAT